jgi:glycogen debranching enzyme
MHVEIKVGPPVLTINQGKIFLVTGENGEIRPGHEQGFFAYDTRLISRYGIAIEGRPWILSTAATTSYYSERIYLLSPDVETATGVIGKRDLVLTLERTIGEGIHEDYLLNNYSTRELQFRVELEIGSDFADIFEVRAHNAVQRGTIETTWDAGKSVLTTLYSNRDFHRGVECSFHCEQSKPVFANGRIVFPVRLPAGGSWRSCVLLSPILDGKVRRPVYGCSQGTEGRTELDRLQQMWQDSTTRIDTPASEVQNAYKQSVTDMGALRMYDHDTAEQVWMPAAGVPWYVTMFGRDSLIASLQNMLVNNALAEGTLQRLAELQASQRDDYRDAQPGKILHEIRHGELAHFHLIPHTPYYGTADATILFLILVSEAYRWCGREDLLRTYRDNCLRCLEWIDRFGDLDGDGFQEYKTFSPKGYHNMSWKDAGNAVLYPDGTQVEQPIATCELQGYVFDAKTRMAEVFETLGDSAAAEQLRSQSAQLKKRFNETFWLEESGFYAYALDPDKRAVATVASNPGQLLWSGIVEPQERAAAVIARLLQPDMFTGWGIRTMSSHNPGYNPHDYQNGSVWPHDNGIIALGAKRYGLWQETNQIAKAIFDACAGFVGYRLPELIAGLDREPGDSFPVQYVGANIPQAWAAGSVFMLLRAILGIDGDVPNKTLWVEPTLPEWLPQITLEHMQLGSERIAIRFSGQGADSEFEVLESGGFEVRRRRVRSSPDEPAGVPRRAF